jgi:hypothetical protein
MELSGTGRGGDDLLESRIALWLVARETDGVAGDRHRFCKIPVLRWPLPYNLCVLRKVGLDGIEAEVCGRVCGID